ncbi:hypothetical protein B0H34DRAFT_529976 [Crassisporium funariophilum]|nr:hypothetical protein B0H34DRAFT_529976 [Crassisporium funariophilum]
MNDPGPIPELQLVAGQAQSIIRKHLAGHSQSTIRSVTEIKNKGYSLTSGIKTYILDLASIENVDTTPPCSCFLTIASVPAAESQTYTYQPNSLAAVHKILTLIRTNTEIPIPDSILDTTLDLVPFHYLLSPASPIASSDIVSVSTARKSGMLSAEDSILIDLQIGRFLGQLHSGVQNDWYGLPQVNEPKEPSYSWQETFTVHVENLLGGLEAEEVPLPYEDIRRYLSRAIGSFLFDDVEVPSLIWFTGSDEDIYVSLPSHPATKVRGIVAILPNVAHALWGDPLLESFFLPPGPSEALLQGYTGSGGGQLFVFPRQKTKRMWYTLSLALLVLQEHRVAARMGKAGSQSQSESEVSEAWAMSMIAKTVESLKDAPSY